MSLECLNTVLKTASRLPKSCRKGVQKVPTVRISREPLKVVYGMSKEYQQSVKRVSKARLKTV